MNPKTFGEMLVRLRVMTEASPLDIKEPILAWIGHDKEVWPTRWGQSLHQQERHNDARVVEAFMAVRRLWMTSLATDLTAAEHAVKSIVAAEKDRPT